nr:MAG TPA: hypothetical protein [Caudoviricetes sp.]
MLPISGADLSWGLVQLYHLHYVLYNIYTKLQKFLQLSKSN